MNTLTESSDDIKICSNKINNDSSEKTFFASKLNLKGESLMKFNNDIHSENSSLCLSEDFKICFWPIEKDPLIPIIAPNGEENFSLDVYTRNRNTNILKRVKIKKNIAKIFNVKKSKKLGRYKKNSTKKGKHDKYQKDNIIRRFKAHLSKNILNFVNSCFLINKNIKTKKQINVLKTINSKSIKSISKLENIKWLYTPLKDFFSQNITTKLCHYNLDFNQQLIKKIYKQNEEKKVISILNKNIRDMWRIYINDIKDENYIGFQTLIDDIEQFQKNGENEEYIRKYKIISYQFENIFNRIISRSKKK